MCVCGGRGKLCLCLCVYLREQCVLAHRLFLMGRFVLYTNHALLLLLASDWGHLVIYWPELCFDFYLWSDDLCFLLDMTPCRWTGHWESRTHQSLSFGSKEARERLQIFKFCLSRFWQKTYLLPPRLAVSWLKAQDGSNQFSSVKLEHSCRHVFLCSCCCWQLPWDDLRSWAVMIQ